MLVRHACGLVVVAALTACSSFDVVQPKDGAIITLPARTKVAMQGNPGLSGVQVKVDGADVSNQMNYVASARSEGDLALLAGNHTINVQADVPCWYCSGQSYRPTEQRKICVIPPGPLTGPSKTARSNATGKLSWSTASSTSVVVGIDASTPKTRWNFRRLGGFASTTGLIESAEFPCRCLRSMAATQGEPIGLATCDDSDVLQQWQSLPEVTFGPGNFRFQNNGRGISDACLTEGAAPDRILLQRACNTLSTQAWSIKDNTTGMVGGAPW
ncbi:MAG: ricin-type beta-trefoil lectin domain protein [Burkholderiaceae bacterium]